MGDLCGHKAINTFHVASSFSFSGKSSGKGKKSGVWLKTKKKATWLQRQDNAQVAATGKPAWSSFFAVSLAFVVVFSWHSHWFSFFSFLRMVALFLCFFFALF